MSDVHRNMLVGGIYLYPQGTLSPEGKLRLLYEANPMAFLTEQAGGRATNGSKRILDIEPTGIHQRSPFICGNTSLVKQAERFILNS